MAISVLYNIPSLAAENQLNVTNMDLQNTLYQLSTGSRINSGADDAAGLAIANGLGANVTALTQSGLNATEGADKLQVADGALSQVTTLLNRAVTLATESANGTINDGSQRQALDAEFTAIKAEIDRIGGDTTYNGSQIFSGGGTNYNQVVSDNLAAPAGLATAVSGTLAIKSTGGATIYTTQATDATVGDVINDINGSGSGLVATLNASGQLVVTDAENRGTSAANELAADAATGNFKVGGVASGNFDNTTNSSTMSVFLSDSTPVGSSTIGVTLGQFSSNNMNGISLANDNLQTAGSSQTALTDINNAISQVSALRGNIGASVNRLQAAGNVISAQIQNLTSAQSDITSADIPTEVANLTKYSILNQTGISALAQANQMQQAVLKLLQ
jgi:flagellin